MVILTVPMTDVKLNDGKVECAADFVAKLGRCELTMDYEENPRVRDSVIWARFYSKSCPPVPDGPKQHVCATPKDGREPMTEPLEPKAPQLTHETTPHKSTGDILKDKK